MTRIDADHLYHQLRGDIIDALVRGASQTLTVPQINDVSALAAVAVVDRLKSLDVVGTVVRAEPDGVPPPIYVQDDDLLHNDPFPGL